MYVSTTRTQIMYTQKNIPTKITEHNRKSTKNHIDYSAFFKIPRKSLSEIASSIINLCFYQQRATGIVYFSQEYIAKKTLCHRVTVNRTMKELDEYGIVRKVYRHAQSCLYYITFLPVLAPGIADKNRALLPHSEAHFQSNVTQVYKKNTNSLKKLEKRKISTVDNGKKIESLADVCHEYAIKAADCNARDALAFNTMPQWVVKKAYCIWKRRRKWVKNKQDYIFACCKRICAEKGIELEWVTYYQNCEKLDLIALEKKQKELISNKKNLDVFRRRRQIQQSSALVEEKKAFIAERYSLLLQDFKKVKAQNNHALTVQHVLNNQVLFEDLFKKTGVDVFTDLGLKNPVLNALTCCIEKVVVTSEIVSPAVVEQKNTENGGYRFCRWLTIKTGHVLHAQGKLDISSVFGVE